MLHHGHLEQTRPKDWGSREKHPFYDRWHGTQRDGSCPEWNDFWQFVADVGDQPSKRHVLKRFDIKAPWSPANCYWQERSPSPDRAAFARKWRQKNLARARGYYFKRHYGITLAEYHAMLEKQDGKCAICGEHESTFHKNGTRRSLAIDHDPENKRVRGLLCGHCNRGLGFFRHDPEVLRNAIAYLNSG